MIMMMMVPLRSRMDGCYPHLYPHNDDTDGDVMAQHRIEGLP